MGLPGDSVVKKLPTMQDTWIHLSCVLSLRVKWHPPVTLPGGIPWTGVSVGYSS